jgi:hypothetical protein
MDNVVTTAGLFVLPEYVYGALLSVVACFAAFIAYVGIQENLEQPTLQQICKILYLN